MTNEVRMEILKAIKYGYTDEAIASECGVTPEQVHEVRVEYERGMCNATD